MAVPPYVTAGTAIEETWGDQIAESVVNPFASAAARSSAITAPVNGMTTAITAASALNGLEVYNGVSWRKPWSMPWGFVNVYTPASFNFNVTIGYSATFSPTLVQNRLYKFSITGRFENGAVTGVVDNLALYINTGNVLVQSQLFMFTPQSTNSTAGGTGTTYYTAAASGALAFKLGAASTASATNQQYITTNIIVEDIGPNGAPV
jgi:hypothetical protein